MKNENFNELEIENLIHGYSYDEDKKEYKCIFCGKTYEDGVIYEYENKLVMAEKKIELHIEEKHEGVFLSLLALEKDINGLSDVQKKLLSAMADRKDNKEIAEDMNISPSTVRTHKFYLQKMKKQAKIFLAIMKALEKESAMENKRDKKKMEKYIKELESENIFSINSLHPFFTQYNLK